MSREARALILTAVALLLLRLGLTGEHVFFVKPSMGPYLVVAGAVVAAFAVIVMLEPGSEEHHHHGDHRLAWLLVLPLVVVFVIGPTPLGSFMASRQPRRTVADPGSSADFRLPPLVSGAAELSVSQVNQRGLYDAGEHMEGVRLRVVGFVSKDSDGPGGTFLLTRFVLSCCAADAYPVSIRVTGVKHIPADDTWLQVEGHWRSHGLEHAPDVETIDADTLTVIPAPADPYLPT